MQLISRTRRGRRGPRGGGRAGGDPAVARESPPPHGAPAPGHDELAQAHLTRARMVATLVLFASVTVAVCLAAAAFGTVHISLIRALREPLSPDPAILFGARLPRVPMGAGVGPGLAAG